MRDEIEALWKSKDPLCEQGRCFLADRFLSIPDSIKKGVCSKDGNIYFLYTRNGEVVRWKSRSMADKKQQMMSKLSEEEKESFKMPFFSQFKCPTSNDLIITEGEFDSIALTQLGAINCVSLPNGAQSVESSFKNNYEFLQQFEKIYIAFDMDKSGEEAAKKAMSMISPSKYRRICFPCKDANDWIIQESPAEDDLKILMQNAKGMENKSITPMGELPDMYYAPIDLGISSGWHQLDSILGGLRTGEVTVLTADTGAGKSTFCINLFKKIAEQGKGIWLNSYEMDPKMTTRKLAGLILGKKMKYQEFTALDKQVYSKWMKDKRCFLNTGNQKVDIESLRNLFEMASLAYGVQYILLDHLDYIHSNGKKKTTLENIDDAVRELHSLAMEFNVGVILVVHPKQIHENKEITMNELKGSSSIKQYADNIIILTRMDRIDENDKLRVKVRVCKNRLNGIENYFYLRYVAEIDGYTESF